MGKDYVQCGVCGGSGKIKTTYTDDKGKSHTVTVDCGGCRGSGVIPR